MCRMAVVFEAMQKWGISREEYKGAHVNADHGPASPALSLLIGSGLPESLGEDLYITGESFTRDASDQI